MSVFVKKDMQAYMIHKNNKMIGFYHMNKPYVVGFKNAHIARNVMYHLPLEPSFTLLQRNPIMYQDSQTGVDIRVDNEATIFIPKTQFLSLSKDEGYYLLGMDYEEFVVYPYTKNIGVILPYVLLDENEEEFVYRSHVIEPLDLSSFVM